MHVAANVPGVVLRGDLPAPGRPRPLADHRHRRLRAVPGLRRRLAAARRARRWTIARPSSTTPATPAASAPAARVPAPRSRMTSPADGGTVSRDRPGRARGDRGPGAAAQSVEFQRSVGRRAWTSLGTDSSSPAYTVDRRRLGPAARHRGPLPRDPARAGVVQVTSAPGHGDHRPAAARGRPVTVAGSLQSELGCPGDWRPDCAATHLAFDTSDGKWHGTFTLPGRRLRVEGRDQRLVDRQLRRRRCRGRRQPAAHRARRRRHLRLHLGPGHPRAVGGSGARSG